MGEVSWQVKMVKANFFILLPEFAEVTVNIYFEFCIYLFKDHLLKKKKKKRHSKDLAL